MTGQRHILLIDDQPRGLESLDFRLKQTGYRTTIAQNGELGLQALRKDPPAAVILDVTMPELNGYQTCRELKRLDANMPVIILTGKTEPADRFWALECGADEFVTKPVDPAVILQKLAHLLES
jgi:DNA-binding response OmpR family regulator